ncbi:hypothetical protein E0Z10_g8353 [Xylaria hypoxylon]|uniref:Uncharacterized protein n=1 Tax=Xylaria hypoxylon TaxID=37992 RepID=A0A4Z0YVG3_9PEZI|nr:hypothetical protein E0Z10_g8353 [Xylaria hypoxylon]
MDPSGMDYTIHHPNHHHPHYHHPNGASSSASAARCPALRAAAEQRSYHLPTISSTRGPVQYDPVHAHSGNRNVWQSRSPQNWRPAMISPFAQDPMMMGPFPPTPAAPTQLTQPQQPPCPMPDISNMANVSDLYPQQMSSFQQFRPAMHPAPRLLSHHSYESPGGFASSNPSQSNNAQHPSNRPTHRVTTGLPSAASLLSVPPVQVPTSRPSANPLQMGQATPFGNENGGNGQQLPNLIPHIFPHQNSSPSFSRRPPDGVTQATAPVEEDSPRQAASHSPAPASTAPQRTTDQPSRMVNNPVEIRRASTAAMGRARRSMSRYTATPSEWLSENGILFRRGDMSLMEFVENFPGAVSDGEGPAGGRFLRGNTSGKRVASRKALASLQSVSITELPESERTCVICYNDFGVANPEGVNEAPLRLPKSRRSYQGFRFVPPYQITAQHLAPGYQGREQGQSRDHDASESESSHQPGQSSATDTTDRQSQFPDVPSNRPPSGNRRAENIPPHGMRLPSWNSSYERRSPPVEYDRRRRARQRARVSPPSTRPSVFGGPVSNGASQTSVRPSRSSRSRSPFDPTSTGVDSSSRRSLTNSPEQYHWNGSPSPNSTAGAITSSPPSGPVFDASGFDFQSQMAMPPDDFFRGFAPANLDVAQANGHSSGLPQMRSDSVRFSSPSTPTGSSDIYVANSGHANSNQFTSYQQS